MSSIAKWAVLLLLSLGLILTATKPAAAADLLPEGTEITKPNGEFTRLDETWYLINDAEMRITLIRFEQGEICAQSLATCYDNMQYRDEQKGFWNSTTGKGVVIGGFTVTVSLAFIGGVWAAKNL